MWEKVRKAMAQGAAMSMKKVVVETPLQWQVCVLPRGVVCLTKESQGLP